MATNHVRSKIAVCAEAASGAGLGFCYHDGGLNVEMTCSSIDLQHFLGAFSQKPDLLVSSL